jgi:GH15 family glucan-1,4-alpha-glucosidase
LRNTIKKEVLERGFDTKQNTFVQSYGSTVVDAAALLIPTLGFLPPDDERVLGTVAAVERKLLHDGFVMRYEASANDGLAGDEGTFLMCTFWLVDNYAMTGRRTEARQLYQRLLDLRNDVGLLSEEYDPTAKRMLGNFPQAFSHLGLVNSAYVLDGKRGARGIRHPETAMQVAREHEELGQALHGALGT